MNVNLLRRAQVEARVGLGRSAIYLLISQGKFPPPVKLGTKAVAWIDRDIDQWINERIRVSHSETIQVDGTINGGAE